MTTLRVVRGDPSETELAALVAVVAARSAANGSSSPRAPSRWADPARRLRPQVRAGRDAWGASAQPR